MNAAAFFAFISLASALLAWIDLRRGIIPDWLNFAITLVGLVRVIALDGTVAALVAASEALIVGASVWLLRALYFRLRGFQGLGLGDVKLLAASTLWVGVAGIPPQILVASLSALVAAGILQLAGSPMTRRTSIPFGPFLALGLLVALALAERGGAIG